MLKIFFFLSSLLCFYERTNLKISSVKNILFCSPGFDVSEVFFKTGVLVFAAHKHPFFFYVRGH